MPASSPATQVFVNLFPMDAPATAALLIPGALLGRRVQEAGVKGERHAEPPPVRELVQRREGEALARRSGSPEQREAVAAFREKRPPNFRGL